MSTSKIARSKKAPAPKPTFFPTPADLRAWLERHHATHQAGLRAFAARTAAKTGVYSFERNEAATLPAPQEELLRSNRKACAFFDAQPPWYRRATIHWVISAKREETRDRRLAQLIAHSAAGRTVPPLTRPAAARVAPSREEAKRRAR